jgi:hypothetical protein
MLHQGSVALPRQFVMRFPAVAASLYDIYLNGMLEDLHRASEKALPDPTRFDKLEKYQRRIQS